MNDRQRLSWAFQTEATVRLSKVEKRDSLDDIDHTLDSKYLFDVYPSSTTSDVVDEGCSVIAKIYGREFGPPPKDIHAWNRKCHPSFARSRTPDGSLTQPLEMSQHDMYENYISNDMIIRR